jgi:hypothetical protein
MMRELTPVEKFGVEVRAVLDRWTEESDLADLELAEEAARVVNEWLDEDFMIFEADDYPDDGESG